MDSRDVSLLICEAMDAELVTEYQRGMADHPLRKVSLPHRTFSVTSISSGKFRE